jgi:hypothetical protein
MTRSTVFLVSAVINISTLPALASECPSPGDIAASRTRWATVRSQLVRASDNETSCRAYAASFYESVTLRQVVAKCAPAADHDRSLAALDSEVDSFNTALATKCGT